MGVGWGGGGGGRFNQPNVIPIHAQILRLQKLKVSCMVMGVFFFQFYLSDNLCYLCPFLNHFLTKNPGLDP